MRRRAILHIDMNAFYASVEQHKDPSIRNKPVVVAGDPKKRNGIILAKSREAKAAGVKTAQALWEAKQACPNLIVVPPDYAAYKKYSRLARSIYYEYTDQVEPFGLDEAWIDVTGSLNLFGSQEAIAREISERVKSELGLTVSIGSSWNKVFAKLGSDIDPGDGVVPITPDNYREVAWPLPAKDLICVGAATARKLHSSGVDTIGDVAHISDAFCKNRFGGTGKVGRMLRAFARGEDPSPVKMFDPNKADVDYAVKGIGNGLTAPHDLESEEDVRALVWLLSESVAQRMRESCFRCRTVAVGARLASDLSGYTRQHTLRTPTCITKDIADSAMGLLRNAQPLNKENALRAIHVRATNLVPMAQPVQDDLFGDGASVAKMERLELAIDGLRRRFGNKCVYRMVELTDETMAHLDIKRDNTVHPVGFLR
ncbi:DNA polymerase Y family protein [Xiamenia xianingshaonis]|uniref:DNA polymerase IV n=1 Tax=Xiamenia xianingshaonis TaxID=2682776 RepID=A0A9E6SUV1_9ACTN|nr:DNA polymerase IV [Xiamenia xianingshaonis]NHM14432.1 DNA polymerase IV [Xiamenia xianingshaonis]QTU84906.1 DNA polymerase IV [Xiamenia xianingshaonis]